MSRYILFAVSILLLCVGLSVSAQGGTGSISVTVYETDGVTPISDVRLTLSSINDPAFDSSARTNLSGEALFSDIPEGKYTICAYSQSYVMGCYENKLDRNADPVEVLANQITSIAIRMPHRARISGVVFDENGLPVESARVSFSIGEELIDPILTFTTTERDGSYSIMLDPGNYIVRAYAPSRQGVIFYNDQNSFWSATRLSLSAGELVDGIDLQFQPEGSISGTILSESGAPLTEAVVEARFGSLVSDASVIQPDGRFQLSGLPAGAYHLRASAPGYRTEYYSEIFVEWDAPLVEVHGNTDTPGIHIRLNPLGTVSGTAYSADGITPLPNVGISALWEHSDGERSQVCTDENGNYILPNVPTRISFVVFAFECDPDLQFGYAPEYWQNSRNQNNAIPLQLDNDLSLNGIDFTPELGGRIQGSIRIADSPDPYPVGNTTIYFYNRSDGVLVAQTNDVGSGFYTSPLLPPDDYLVQVSNPFYTYVYVTLLSEAIPASVQTGETTPVDILLPLPDPSFTVGKIRGTVFAPDGVTPIQSRFRLYRAREVGETPILLMDTTSSGTYYGDFSWLTTEAGVYYLQAFPLDYLPEFYGGAFDIEQAQPIVTDGNQDIYDINFTVDEGVAITGTIFDALSGLPTYSPTVQVIDESGMVVSSGGFISEAGTFRLVVPPGRYTLYAADEPYNDGRFYGDASDFAEAQFMNVSEGTPVRNINITLERLSEVSES